MVTAAASGNANEEMKREENPEAVVVVGEEEVKEMPEIKV